MGNDQIKPGKKKTGRRGKAQEKMGGREQIRGKESEAESKNLKRRILMAASLRESGGERGNGGSA